jgi:peroxiredoxin Q/BCP
MATPFIGSTAPDFELPAADGLPFRLSAQRGTPVVLYFYPQDDTEGCTIENRDFSALLPEFERLGAKVVGISPDSVEKHCRFRDKYRLATALLADPGHLAIGSYGVWGPKVTFGHHLIGLIRSTFLVDAGGNIAAQWQVRRIKGHAEAVLEATRRLIEHQP